MGSTEFKEVKWYHVKHWMDRKSVCQVISLMLFLFALSAVATTQIYRTTIARRDLLFKHAADRESDSVFRIFTRHIQNNEALASQFETFSDTMYVNSSVVARRRLHTGSALSEAPPGYRDLIGAFNQFTHLSNTFRSQLGGIAAYGFAPKIYDDVRAEYETASSVMWNYFANRSLVPQDRTWEIRPSTNPYGYAHPVAFIDPQEGNVDAINFDLHSNNDRKLAIDAARRSLLSKLTPPIKLVQDLDGGFAVLCLSPVAGTEDFASAVFRLFNVLTDAISGEFSTPGLRVYLWHLNTAGRQPNCAPGSSRRDSCYSTKPGVVGTPYLKDNSFQYISGASSSAVETLHVNKTLDGFAASFLENEPNHNANLLVVYRMAGCPSLTQEPLYRWGPHRTILC